MMSVTKDKLVRNCSNCLKGTKISVNNDIICREKGIVSRNYYCSNHLMIIEDELSRKMLDYKCADCIYFDFHYHPDIPTYGVCSLFSVRKCDGSERKACSKFSKRSEKKDKKRVPKLPAKNPESHPACIYTYPGS